MRFGFRASALCCVQESEGIDVAEHFLDHSVTQPFWDRDAPPRLVVASGDVVRFDCPEATGQLTSDSTVAEYMGTDRSKIHALVGSVAIDGSEPGDAIEIDILDMQHKGWGWTGHKPGFGLLDGDFTDPYLHLWKLDGDRCHFGKAGIVLPFEPMPGCLGVAPAERGRFDTVPPRANGGNVDIRDLTTGAKVWLPVLAPGGLVSVGDCHAAQGQGEVCGTGIECPREVTLRLKLRRDLKIKELQFRHPGPGRRIGDQGWHGTTAHGPDLFKNAQNAVRAMIDWLMTHEELSAEEAYALCSCAADLQIAEIVDRPNWIVSCSLPLSIFSEGGAAR